MEKIRDAKFPQTKKEMRSFLGLLNSIRRTIKTDTVREMNSLAPLTSSKKDVPYRPESKHHNAFENIKRMLLSEPIFCNLVDEHATKYMFVDACTTTSTLGCTLMQKIDSSTDDKILPTCLNLDDKVHRIIFDKQLPYQPCKLITKFPVEPLKPTEVRTTPPDISPRDKWLGFTKETIHDSFFWSIISCYVTYGCKIPESILELREMATKQIRKGVVCIWGYWTP